MPCFSAIEEQPVYKSGSGEYYSLLMGKEFQPGKFVILLDFDNKVDLESKNGLELAKLLNMDQYKAPKATTPNGGLHYLFYVGANQAVQIRSRNGLHFNGTKYNADVKFKNSLCNCAPSKIENHGEYKWVNPSKLRSIPKLPDELFNVIKNHERITKILMYYPL